MSRTLYSAILAAALVLPASVNAGEVTGTGEPIDVNGRSECAFSGLNDHDGDPRDPGGHAQSYGQNVVLIPLDPSNFDPNAEFFQPIPGFACNPNRGRDLHDD